MPKTRQQKETELKDFKEKLATSAAGACFFVNYRGLNVEKLMRLRRQAKKSGGELAVIKKTLARLAFQNAGFLVDPTALAGEVGFVFGYTDAVATARALYQFSRKESKPAILGGWFERKFLNAQEVIALATLPSREALLGQLAGAIAGPMRGLVTVLEETMAGFVRVLHAKASG